jgi:hypothetical protein
MKPRAIQKARRALEKEEKEIYWHQVTGAVNPQTGTAGYRELPGREFKPPKDEDDEQRIADRIMAAAERRLRRRNKRAGGSNVSG